MIVSFYWECADLKVEHIILQKKLMFFHHLMNLPTNSLAFEVLEIQLRNQLPGLGTDMEEHLVNIGATEVRGFPKLIWKRKVKEYVKELNKTKLLEESKKYKKIEYSKLVKDTYERKDYFKTLDLEDARLRFRISSNMVDSVRSNFPGKYRAKGKPLACPFCSKEPETNQGNSTVVDNSPRDNVDHIMTECKVYEDMRANRDIMTSDSDLVAFFKEVIEYRRLNNEE